MERYLRGISRVSSSVIVRYDRMGHLGKVELVYKSYGHWIDETSLWPATKPNKVVQSTLRALSDPFCHSKLFASCHPEEAKPPKNLTEGRLREESRGLSLALKVKLNALVY